MRILTLCLIGSLGLSACGGAYDKSAASPPHVGGRPGPAREMSKKSEADNDSDGIPDPSDVKQRDEIASIGAGPGSMGGNAPTPAAPAPPGQPGSGASGGATTAQAPQRDAFLIYTATLTMAVYQVEGALGQVVQVGRDVRGYLAV